MITPEIPLLINVVQEQALDAQGSGDEKLASHVRIVTEVDALQSASTYHATSFPCDE
jgi:hypothetical protein